MGLRRRRCAPAARAIPSSVIRGFTSEAGTGAGAGSGAGVSGTVVYSIQMAGGAVVPGVSGGGAAGAPGSGPLRRPGSGAQVAAWIRAEILRGALRRGDRVTQEDVARELGVSRIPVREALVALDVEGWITIEPHRGAFVRGVDAVWVQDHYDVLGRLYGLAARRAAERGTLAERAELAARRRDHDAASDLDSFDAQNHALLAHVLAMARSPRLVTALRSTGSVVPGNFFAAVPDTVAAQRDGIRATADAIAAGDPAAAEAALDGLIARQGQAVVALLRTRGVLDVGEG